MANGESLAMFVCLAIWNSLNTFFDSTSSCFASSGPCSMLQIFGAPQQQFIKSSHWAWTSWGKPHTICEEQTWKGPRKWHGGFKTSKLLGCSVRSGVANTVWNRQPTLLRVDILARPHWTQQQSDCGIIWLKDPCHNFFGTKTNHKKTKKWATIRQIKPAQKKKKKEKNHHVSHMFVNFDPNLELLSSLSSIARVRDRLGPAGARIAQIMLWDNAVITSSSTTRKKQFVGVGWATSWLDW